MYDKIEPANVATSEGFFFPLEGLFPFLIL